MISPFVNLKSSGSVLATPSPLDSRFSTSRKAFRHVGYWRGAAPAVDRSACVAVSAESDIARARDLGREIAACVGFAAGDQTVIAAAISEVARNIVLHAGQGEITLSSEDDLDAPSIVVVARDTGPGIRDITEALREGFSTAGRAGLGLPGARRLMDVFEIVSAPGKGTTITMRKWRRHPA